MRIGIPAEIKLDEHRVAVTAAGVRELVAHGHEVLIEAGAGAGAGISDEIFESQGATILRDREDVWAEAELLVKVKEPQPDEVALIHEELVVFAYLHLAPEPELARGLAATGATCIAFETVTDSAGRLPLLAPMSAVAGRIATQVGARLLERAQGGPGILMGGIPGVPAARVLVIGGGVVGTHAAAIAAGMQADVTVLDRSVERLDFLADRFGGTVRTRFSSSLAIEEELRTADLVIGAVLIRGARAPRLVRREHLRLLPKGAVLVDVAIDQGGCFETSKPTTHRDPTFEVDRIVHYCVANMPGTVPVTSTAALSNATLPFVLLLADYGLHRALDASPALRDGVNVAAGHITDREVATAVDLPFVPLAQALPGAFAVSN
jgi:alanine dehydrogenase